MRALEGGFRVYRTGNWRFTVLGRLHFVDIPKNYQNQMQGDNTDAGVQAGYKPQDWPYLELELMSDWWRVLAVVGIFCRTFLRFGLLNRRD